MVGLFYMILVFILIVSVGLYLVFNTLRSATSVPIDCSVAPYGQPKIHKWVQKTQPDEKGYLVCIKCGREPGTY